MRQAVLFWEVNRWPPKSKPRNHEQYRESGQGCQNNIMREVCCLILPHMLSHKLNILGTLLFSVGCYCKLNNFFAYTSKIEARNILKICVRIKKVLIQKQYVQSRSCHQWQVAGFKFKEQVLLIDHFHYKNTGNISLQIFLFFFLLGFAVAVLKEQ